MVRLSTHTAAILCLAALGAPALAAPPKVDYWFPLGVQQGQSVTVTAGGNVANWPPAGTWVDRAGLTLEPAEKKGEFKITAAPDAAGVYWLRVYDQEGASAPRPFVVGALAEAAEAEPNDDPQKPQPLPGPTVVNGKLAQRGDVDGYSIELQAGQTLVASLTANNLFNSPMDGVLQVCNAEGFVLAQNDDARGLDPLLVYQAPQSGTYLVRTFAFPAEPNSSIAFASGDNFAYRLTITNGPFVDHALPLAAAAEESTDLRLFGWNLPETAPSVIVPPAGDAPAATVAPPQAGGLLELPRRPQRVLVADDAASPESPQAVELPVLVSGRIESPKDVDAFRFAAKKGQKIALRVEAGSLGFELDPLLQVTDAQGKSLAEADDAGKERDPVLTFTAPADGEFVATVRDVYFHGGLRYAYRLAIAEEAPDFRLTLAADSFTLAPGKPLEIPVAIERMAGFAGEIEITATDLPEGVSAAPVKSLPQGDTAKTVKLVLTAEKGPVSGPIAIVGRGGEEGQPQRVASFPVAGSSFPHTRAWLTVTKAE